MSSAAWLAALLAAAPARAAEAKLNPLRCPQGTRPVVETGRSLQPYRCERASGGDPAPDEGSYQRFSVSGQLSFEYPSAFRVQDAWSEDVPTLYLKIDDAAAGKPVTITITRYDASQSDYQAMSEAIRRDVEWQGAKDSGTQTIARASARVTDLPGDTRSVYLPVSKESYYSFVYSAPAGSYEKHLPAFSRLLKSLKIPGDAP